MHRKTKKILILIIVLAIILVLGLILYNHIKKSYSVEEVIEEKYKTLEVDDNIGVMDKNGKTIITPQYFGVQIPNPSKAIFVCFYDYNEQTGSYRTKVINSNGTELFTKYNKLEAIELVDIESTMPYEKSVLKYERDGKFGLIDLKGNLVTKAEYESIQGLSNKEGELLISKDGKYGVINTKGAEIIKPEYEYISGDGYYTQEKKYGLSGYILVEKKEDGYRYGYMTYKGKTVLKTEYNDIIRLGGIGSEDTDKDLLLIAQKNGQYGLMRNKKVLIDFKYQSIDYSGVNNLFIVNRSGKLGVYNSAGKNIIKVKYDEVQVHDTYIYVKSGKNEEYHNLLGYRIGKDTIKELNDDKNK